MDNAQLVGLVAPILHAHLVQSHLYVALLAALSGRLGYLDRGIALLLRVFPKAMLEAECDRLDALAKSRIEKDAAPPSVPSSSAAPPGSAG